MIGDQKCSLSRLEPSNRHNFMNMNEKNMKNNDTTNLYHFFLWIHYSIYISKLHSHFLQNSEICNVERRVSRVGINCSLPKEIFCSTPEYVMHRKECLGMP